MNTKCNRMCTVQVFLLVLLWLNSSDGFHVHFSTHRNNNLVSRKNYVQLHDSKLDIDVGDVTSSIAHSTNPRNSLSFAKHLIGGLVSFLVLEADLKPTKADTTAMVSTVYTSNIFNVQKESPGWELERQKRTIAIKQMQRQGILKIDTDESGNQYLKLPWIPGKEVPYKSLSVVQRLQNEVCAGALGEIAKDLILHPVDTLKTRRQSKIKEKEVTNATATISTDNAGNQSLAASDTFSGFDLKGLYAGFPVVLAASIPQGGSFFLVKKGTIELFNNYLPYSLPDFVASVVPISLGVMMYWLFRTPAEVIKTQVQTGQSPSVTASISSIQEGKSSVFDLYKSYSVMLSLDIPFQIINFILYGAVSDLVSNSLGYETSVWTRLFCGITCGMIAAGITCPLDVCKTRIVRREKENNGTFSNRNVLKELYSIGTNEGLGSLFLGIQQRLLYTGLANGIRLAAYGTSRMDLNMKSLDDL